MLISAFKKNLTAIFEAKVTPLVIGPHGIGKTEIVKQYASENGYTVVPIRLGTMSDVGNMLGLEDFERDKNGNIISTRFVKPNWFPTDQDAKVIIHLDEINRGRKDMQQAVFQFVETFGIHTHQLPPNCRIVATMNPPTEDYDVLDFGDKAFWDRFVIIKLTPSVKEWLKYANSIGVEPELVSYVENTNDVLGFGLQQDFSLSEFVKPSARSVIFANRFYKMSKDGKVSSEDLPELLSGLIGFEHANGFLTYLKNMEKPVSGEEIVTKYKSVKARVLGLMDFENGAKNAELKTVVESLLTYVDKSREAKETLTKKEQNNVVEFLVDIPTELMLYAIPTLFEHDSLTEIIENTDALSEKGRKALYDSKNDSTEQTS